MDSTGRPGASPPLSPFLTIFRWPVTMVTSIVHRMSGIALAGGAFLLALWLLAIESGPENYALFYALMLTPVGQLLLWIFIWCYVFHLLNGIRHLFWDFGFGFALKTANFTGIFVLCLSALVTAGLAALIICGMGGYYGAI